MFSIQEALDTKTFKERLNPSTQLYFSSQKHADIVETYGRFVTDRKTNSFNKDEIEACQWVFLSALSSLQERAKRMGANAVVGIHSYYKKITFSSETEYECHDGVFVTGVALSGKVVKIH